MTKAQRINRSMFALGFLGAYSFAALLLLLMLKAVSADAGAGVTHRNIDVAGDDFTSDLVALTELEKFPNRLAPDKVRGGPPDDATSAIGDGPSGSGFFGDNGFSGAPGDFRQASFVTGSGARGGGRAKFAPSFTSGEVPDGALGGGVPFETPTFIPFSTVGSGTGDGGAAPSAEPPIGDAPRPNPPSDPIGDPFGPGPISGPGPFDSPPDSPLPDPGLPSPSSPGGPLDPSSPVVSVPEPLTLSIFAAGLAGAAALRRRRNRSA